MRQLRRVSPSVHREIIERTPYGPAAGAGRPRRFAALVSSTFGSMQSSVGLRGGSSGRRAAATVSALDVEMGGSLQALPFGLPVDSTSSAGAPCGAYMPPILIRPAANTALASEADRGLWRPRRPLAAGADGGRAAQGARGGAPRSPRRAVARPPRKGVPQRGRLARCGPLDV